MKNFLSTVIITAIIIIFSWSTSWSDDLCWFNNCRIVDLEINPQTHYISGSVDHQLVNLTTSDSIVFDLISLTVDSVKTNNTNHSFYRIGDSLLVVSLGQNYFPGDILDVEIFYQGVPSTVPSYFGNGGLVFQGSLFFSCHAPWGLKAWVPCLDAHRHKAEVSQWITVPEPFYVMSNGNLDSVITLSGNRKKYFWNEQAKLSPYLQGIAGCDYTLSQYYIDTIPVTIATYGGDSSLAAYDLRRLDSMTEMFSQRYGPYPFCKIAYSEVTLPGAMENQNNILTGEILFTGTGSYEITHGHELSHQWWGDYVTPVDYGEVWLAEGWATFSEGLLKELFEGTESMHDYMHSRRLEYISFENTNGCYPVHNPPWAYYYSALTYERPGCILYALRYMLGDSIFFQSAQEFINLYGDSCAQWEDVDSVFSEVGGEDLTWFFDQWLNGTGTPNLYFEVLTKDNNPDSIAIISWVQSNTATNFIIELPVEIYEGGCTNVLAQATVDTAWNYYCFNYDSVLIDPNYTQFINIRQRITSEILKLIPLDQQVVVYWNSSSFPQTAGYNVYFASDPFQNYIKVNSSLITDTVYTVGSLNNGEQYSFYITYQTSAGWESYPGDTFMCSPVSMSFDRNILVVDESEGGSGATPIMPTDQMLDSAYQEMFNGISYDIYHCNSSLPDLSLLGHYTTVFWHSDEYTSTTQIFDDPTLIQSYISGGGKLVLTGWRVFEDIDQDMLNFLGLDSAVVVTSKTFQSGVGYQGFPHVDINSALMLPSWNGRMDRAGYFISSDADTLGAWELDSVHQGKPITLGRRGSVNFVLNGYPLYFIQHQQAVNWIVSCFQYLDQTAVELKPVDQPNQIRMSYQDGGSINFNLPQSVVGEHLEIKIYDILGRVVFHQNVDAGKSYYWSWRNNQGEELPLGIYYVQMHSGSFQYRQKIIHLR
ncbi:MAG: hypothetical protein APR63_12520 [Desulfuromonas sp. SDB]|nr:MAG: hypothetical protein APR63_12520 [Desulfuromonas sp. SDB]